MSLFDNCLTILDREKNCGPSTKSDKTDATFHEAHQFLQHVQYFPDLTIQDSSHDENILQTAHRRHLIRLAARLKHVFQLPLHRSPGVHFFGATANASTFGLSGFEKSAAMNAAGRGLSPRQAFESCMGEAAEHLSFLEWPEDADRARWTGKASTVPEDPDAEWSFAGTGDSSSAEVGETAWVRADPILDGEAHWFPADLCLRRPDHLRIGDREAESNGCAAGTTLETATASALTELIERDAVALWWYGGAQAARLSAACQEEYGLDPLLSNIRPNTRRQTWFLTLPTDLQIPVLAALSSEPDGTAVVAGFAAAPDPGQAATRALLEMCQMELAQDLAVLRARDNDTEDKVGPDNLWLERWRRLSVSTYPQLRPEHPPISPPGGFVDTPTLESLCAALDRKGLTAYKIDLTRKSIGIPVVRILVPGLQSTRPRLITNRLKRTAEANSIDLKKQLLELSPI